MAHITSIGAGMFSGLAIATPAAAMTAAQLAELDTYSEFAALFATEIKSQGGVPAAGAFCDVANVREFPPLGTPPNVVNVPNYGSATSQQIQGQADPSSMELTLNYIPSDWATGTVLGGKLGNGIVQVFRFSLLNADPTGSGPTKLASLPAGLGTVENSQWFFLGKLEALQVNPQLTDANQATVTVTLQSRFFGAYTSPAA